MRNDDRGIDTVIGTLLLVMVCFFATVMLIAFDRFEQADSSQALKEMEERFDYSLCSSIDLRYDISGLAINRTTSISDFAVLVASGWEYYDFVSNDTRLQISSIFDFYFWQASAWDLTIATFLPVDISLAERGDMSRNATDKVVLQRDILSQEAEWSRIRLTVEL